MATACPLSDKLFGDIGKKVGRNVPSRRGKRVICIFPVEKSERKRLFGALGLRESVLLKWISK